MRRLFILRPEPGASATAERARALGLDCVRVPLFEVEPLPWSAPDPAAFDALLLTSANALRCGGDQLARLRSLPVHAIGEATADAARASGFDVATTGEAALGQLLKAVDPDLRLLHLAGEDRTCLDEVRQVITVVIVYRARPIDVGDGLGELSGQVACVHSPRAGRRLAQLVERELRAGTRIAAISAAAAEAAGDGWESIEAADAPTDSALLALAARLCEDSAQQ